MNCTINTLPEEELIILMTSMREIDPSGIDMEFWLTSQERDLDFGRHLVIHWLASHTFIEIFRAVGGEAILDELMG